MVQVLSEKVVQILFEKAAQILSEKIVHVFRRQKVSDLEIWAAFPRPARDWRAACAGPAGTSGT